MAVSRQKTSAKSGKKTSVPSKAKPVSAASAPVRSKSASGPQVSAASSEQDAPIKRVVMTSSEIEAAAKQGDEIPAPTASIEGPVSSPDKDATPAESADAVVTVPAAVASEQSPGPAPADFPAEKPVLVAAPVAKAPLENAQASKIDAPKSSPAAKKASPIKPKAASSDKSAGAPAKSPVAKVKADAVPPVAKTMSKAPKPVSSTETERVRTVNTASKPVAVTKKAAASSTPKKATAPKKVAAVSAAKPASKPVSKPVAVKAVEPKAGAAPAKVPAKVEDAFGFGAMFMTPDAMEKYLALWKAPELDAMMSAGSDALEEGMSVANEAFAKLVDTMTGQSDVFSDAGSRMAAQCEELLGSHQKNVEEFWQTSMALFEKTGGIGTELATWMQREIEASQADIDALTKAESVSDIQELQSKIMTRYVESTVAESEKVQEIMFAAMTDSFNAMSKAAGAVMK